MKLVYIAGRFSGPTRWQVYKNVLEAESAGLAVATLDAMPVIPHRNTENFEGLKTPAFWYEGTVELMRRCDAVYLFNHHDYSMSKGVKEEIEEAKAIGLPWFMTIGDLKIWLQNNTMAPVMEKHNEHYLILRNALIEARKDLPEDHWFDSPSPSLGGQIPLEVLATPEGLRSVAQLLQRLDHGLRR